MLLEHTYTRDNLHRKMLLLEEFFEKVFFQEHTSEGSLKDRLRDFLLDKNVGEYLRNSLLSLSDEFYAQFTSDSFRNIFDTLRKEMDNLPHMKLYVPTLLPPVEVEKLGKWCRENVAPNMFLDLEVEPSTVGGCAFVWNGVYHDFSLSYFIEAHKSQMKQLIGE